MDIIRTVTTWRNEIKYLQNKSRTVTDTVNWHLVCKTEKLNTKRERRKILQKLTE